MICKLCQGSGNLICFPSGKPEWWQCPACGGEGVRYTGITGPIKIHKPKYSGGEDGK